MSPPSPRPELNEASFGPGAEHAAVATHGAKRTRTGLNLHRRIALLLFSVPNGSRPIFRVTCAALGSRGSRVHGACPSEKGPRERVPGAGDRTSRGQIVRRAAQHVRLRAIERAWSPRHARCSPVACGGDCDSLVVARPFSLD